MDSNVLVDDNEYNADTGSIVSNGFDYKSGDKVEGSNSNSAGFVPSESDPKKSTIQRFVETPAKTSSHEATDACVNTNLFNCDDEEKNSVLGQTDISWHCLSVTIKEGWNGGKEKKIVKELSGVAMSGKLTAIIGESGAGKTTLLKALSGRGPVSSGEVLLDGEKIETSSYEFKKRIGFVARDGTFEPTATVLEAVQFSAALRLPKSENDDRVECYVQSILEALKMKSCMNTQYRFLSSGERRRLEIAVELVAQPSVLFLDEPTSGLDSYNAEVLIECLKNVAASGAAIIFVIHHPNPKIFRMIDKVVLLQGGETCLDAPTSSVEDIFAKNGLPVPPGESVSDWMLSTTLRKSKEELAALGFFVPHLSRRSCSSLRESTFRASNRTFNRRNLQFRDEDIEKDWLGIFQEFTLLCHRDFTRRKRAGTATLFQLVIVPIIWGTLLALTFTGVADFNKDDYTFESHLGALFFNFFGAAIIVISLMFNFMEQRPIFEREYNSNMYSLISYSLASLVSDGTVVTLQALMVNLVTFWGLGLQSRFYYLLLIYIAYGWSLGSLCCALGTMLTRVEDTKEMVGLALFPNFLLCGFYVAVSNISPYIQWSSWLMSLTYTFRLAIAEEFKFCGSPSARDAQMLKCSNGLKQALTGVDVYNDASILTLAQTGIYQGVDGIQEYQNLAASGDSNVALLTNSCLISPHLEFLVNSVSEDTVNSVSHTSCDISFSGILMGDINPSVGNYSFESVTGFRLIFDMIGEEKVTVHEENLFLSDPNYSGFIYFNQELATTYICKILEDDCGEKYFTYDSQEECVSTFSTLPLEEVNTFGFHVYTGNSTGCRFIHSSLAKVNPEVHCPHVSFASEKDINGNFKCDDKTLDSLHYNFSTDEYEMFERTAVLARFKNKSMARWIPKDDRLACSDITPQSVLSAMKNAGELQSIEFTCFGYLQLNEATEENLTFYWGAIFALLLLFRICFACGLRWQAKHFK
mmetsp:Transcript_39091/g.44575  ORF Transcript_39091/g.44575 Transcript_39091/m.44575 type:complete len:980 (+) Transcript_39091:87-3026(+)|eukprot:CAMPEP_0194190578 /NCGR_PEP_ID=MMETSP0154-20130528/63457_1 /TAXON_ID=1049557 /ORGANISM="Thalassiothrix antarctica, Strain L6-D1" /LENGTH=979 /DNA_ID=CAMNT_0038912609 /DNA_START=45 /DNA_END=2984 /DNA_ORIENTATION=-